MLGYSDQVNDPRFATDSDREWWKPWGPRMITEDVHQHSIRLIAGHITYPNRGNGSVNLGSISAMIAVVHQGSAQPRTRGRSAQCTVHGRRDTIIIMGEAGSSILAA